MKTVKQFVLVNNDNQEAYLFTPMGNKVKVQYRNWQPDGTDTCYVPEPFMAKKEVARKKWARLVKDQFKKVDVEKYPYMHYWKVA